MENRDLKMAEKIAKDFDLPIRKLEIDYKAFNSGKTNLKNHKEFLYICEVK